MFYRFTRAVLGILIRIWFRLELYGTEYVPNQGGYIFCCNHVSAWDPLIICQGIPGRFHLRYIAKAELFENPFLRFLLKALGAFPVSRGNGDTGAIDTAVSIVQDGGVLGIFPEGTRSPDNNLLRFKSGLALIASRTQSDIFPCAITFTEGRKFRSRIIVTYGPLLPYQELGMETGAPRELKDATRKIQETVQTLKNQHQ